MSQNPSIPFVRNMKIIHETIPPYSLESNGVPERNNRTLKEMMNAILVSLVASLNL